MHRYSISVHQMEKKKKRAILEERVIYLKDQQMNEDFVKNRSIYCTGEPQLLDSPQLLRVKFNIIRKQNCLVCWRLKPETFM